MFFDVSPFKRRPSECEFMNSVTFQTAVSLFCSSKCSICSSSHVLVIIFLFSGSISGIAPSSVAVFLSFLTSSLPSCHFQLKVSDWRNLETFCSFRRQPKTFAFTKSGVSQNSCCFRSVKKMWNVKTKTPCTGERVLNLPEIIVQQEAWLYCVTAVADVETSTSLVSVWQECVCSFSPGHALFPGKPWQGAENTSMLIFHWGKPRRSVFVCTLGAVVHANLAFRVIKWLIVDKRCFPAQWKNLSKHPSSTAAGQIHAAWALKGLVVQSWDEIWDREDGNQVKQTWPACSQEKKAEATSD